MRQWATDRSSDVGAPISNAGGVLLRCKAVDSSRAAARSGIGAVLILMGGVPRTGSACCVAGSPDSVQVAYLRLHVGRVRRPAVAGLSGHERPFGRRASQNVVFSGLG